MEVNADTTADLHSNHMDTANEAVDGKEVELESPIKPKGENLPSKDNLSLPIEEIEDVDEENEPVNKSNENKEEFTEEYKEDKKDEDAQKVSDSSVATEEDEEAIPDIDNGTLLEESNSASSSTSEDEHSIDEKPDTTISDIEGRSNKDLIKDEKLDDDDDDNDEHKKEIASPLQPETQNKDLDNFEDEENLESSTPNNNEVESKDQLHGKITNDSSSSENENEGPLLIREQKEDPDSSSKTEDLAQSLKQALAERERQMQSPFEQLHFDPAEFDEDVDDSSIRARTAEDFESPPPPALPPKMSFPPALPPKTKSKSNNKSYSNFPKLNSSRGRWSEDEELPTAHHYPPRHPPPDRIIDFSDALNKNNKNKRRSLKHPIDNPSSRIIEVPNRPENLNDVFKRQAMVSLHSSAPTHQNERIIPYGSTQDDTKEDLNRLIEEANSLDIKPSSENKENQVDVLLPSFKRDHATPKTDLTSPYPDVFAKLATSQENPESPKQQEDQVLFSAIRQEPVANYPKSLSRKYKPQNSKNFLPRSIDPQDGDDEISLNGSDFRFSSPPVETLKSQDGAQYLSEVYPSDYTEFESASESDATETNYRPGPISYLRDVTPYDSVAETDTEVLGNRVHPLVNEDYQICTAISKNHNTFPRRMNGEKPTPKQRTSLNMMAIALTDPSTNSNIQPSSLPYLGHEPLKRNKSTPATAEEIEPTSLFGPSPHIIVTRGQSAPQGYNDEPTFPLSSGPRSLPPMTKETNEPTQTAPKIHLSLNGQNGNPDAEPMSISNPNNLQINVLPSEDPNVINLNIRTMSSQPGENPHFAPALTSLPIFGQTPPEISPLEVQQMPTITAIREEPNSPNASDPVSSQHRVVDIAPLSFTAPSLTQQQEPSFASQQPTYPQPLSQPFYPSYPQQQPQTAPAQLPHQAVNTQETKVFETNSSAPPVSAVADVNNPWEDNRKSLPSQRGGESGLRHAGDSGIDLTNYDRRSKPRRHNSSSSSDESDYDVRRKSSKRKLTTFSTYSDSGLPDEYFDWYKSKYLKPTCCYLFLKHFIFVLNLLFGIAGLVLTALGIWGFIDVVSKGMKNPSFILEDPIFPIFILGIVLTLVCFQGAIGFYRDNICMIRLFGWFLVTLCITFVGGGIAFWVLRESKVTPHITSVFKNMIDRYSYDYGKVSSFTIDQMQSNFECCGFTSYQNWQANNDFPCENFVCSLPPSCCRPETANCTRSEVDDSKPSDACIDLMSAWLKRSTPIVIGAWLGVFALFIINFVCIYFMIREIIYLSLIEEKILSLFDPETDSDVTTSDDITDSEYEAERRRRRRRRKRRSKRRNRKAQSYHLNGAYN